MWAMLRRIERPVSEELIRFKRKEQMIRLKRLVGKLLLRVAFQSDPNGVDLESK